MVAHGSLPLRKSKIKSKRIRPFSPRFVHLLNALGAVADPLLRGRMALDVYVTSYFFSLSLMPIFSLSFQIFGGENRELKRLRNAVRNTVADKDSEKKVKGTRQELIAEANEHINADHPRMFLSMPGCRVAGRRDNASFACFCDA